MRVSISIALVLALLVSCATPHPPANAVHYIDGLTPTTWRLPDGPDDYPIAQIKHAGFVELEYSVSTEGVPHSIAVVEPSDAAFVPGAIRILERTRIGIPRTWSAEDAQKYRKLIVIAFNVYGAPKIETPTGIETIDITINADLNR